LPECTALDQLGRPRGRIAERERHVKREKNRERERERERERKIDRNKGGGKERKRG